MNEVILAFERAGFPTIVPVRIVKQDSLYSAEATLPDGKWQSHYPMPAGELWKALEAIGCRSPEIMVAFDKAGFHFPSYQEYGEEFRPQVQKALAGEREVPQQQPFAEAWLTFAIYEMDSELTIQMLIEDADSLNHAIPTADEISWAFLCLRKRRWLTERKDLYGLTSEGRRIIASVVGADYGLGGAERLEKWVLAHPAGGDE